MAATTNGDSANDPSVLDEIVSQAPPGTVLPPRSLRDVIEKTAGYVGRNGVAFEERIRGKEGQTAKMSFIMPDDAYHPYYRWRVEEVRAGRGTDIAAGRKPGEGEVSFRGREERKGPEKQEDFKFSARMPNISAQDLEIVRLTALFVAKNGRGWMTTLSQREAGNFQFDFLRPQHSLYQFFSRLVDQYTDLLTGDSVDGGRPQKKRAAELEANVANRFRILERAKKRAEWVKYQEAQKVAKEEQEENERIAYGQIDWHDFAVVETVVFDEADENEDFPAPMRLNDVQSMSLEQKAAVSVNPNRRIEEAMPTFDDYENIYGQPQQMPQAQQAAPAVQQMPPPAQPTPPQHTPQPTAADDEYSRLNTLQADRARARAAQEAAKASAPLKIRRDYVPAAQARKSHSQNTSICPNCHQAIPNEEMENHMRIEMLDPAWREQARVNAQRSSTTNLSTADVANNLKRLASQRSDVFDSSVSGGGGSGVDEEEARRRKRVEMGAYDGVSTMPNPAALNSMGEGGAQGSGQGQGQGERPDVQEQIRLIHERARNG